MDKHLIRKYNVPGPRYTSYPTVPYWDQEPLTPTDWQAHVRDAFTHSNEADGISLYVHLPYCESLCTYCGCHTRITVNHAVEGPYIDALLTEWALYRETFGAAPNIKEIHLGGGTPTFFSADNLRRLIDGLTAGATVRPDAEFSFEAHPNNTRRDHLQTLFDLGFRRVSLGVQDFDPRVQRAINRVQPFEVVAEVTRVARAVGYTSVNFDLVYGLPHQTVDSVAQTIEQVATLRPDRIAFYSYAHVPWLKPAQRKFEAFLPTDAAKRRLYELGRERLETLGYAEIGMDHFALPSDPLYQAAQAGTLHRNFMGYTTGHTQLLVGLGASSISDAWTAFAQNTKTVEQYLAAVRRHELPIFRGHRLTEEDLTLRRHILNLMCRFRTEWTAEDEAVAALTTTPQVRELEADRLVSCQNRSLEVLPAGRPFVRNVCMAFDARLWRARPEAQLFSQTV